ncbi:unnamed protein product [Anisakis simplex]|uniref:DNA topoisomerase 2-binding protein 1 (inferred by orthology to a human protein) n=1 Tax=Anisakis simplex TaxID=6269 RepID=A0A0M3K650_ANISI|nr:unnamed protein product [Anisakis simplex]
MERNRCTHLLTDKNSGEKYRKAREWGWDCVKIVRVKWLDKCVQKGMRIEERLYEPKFSAVTKTSTPQSDAIPPAVFDISCVSSDTRRTSDSISSALVETSSNVNFSSIRRARTDAANSSNTTISDASILHQRLNNNSFRRNQSSRNFASNEDPKIPDPIEVIGLNADAAYDFLENCRLYLCGFTDEELPKWKRVLNALGATRLPDIYSDITHIVVGSIQNSTISVDKLKEKSADISIVTYKWLIECAIQQKLVAEKEFLHPSIYSINNVTEPDRSALRISNSETPRAAVPLRKSLTSIIQRRFNSDHVIDPTETTISINQPVQKNEDRKKADETDAAEGWRNEVAHHNADKLFSGLTFGIDRIDDSLSDDLKVTIREFGGECELNEESRQIDYLILPLFHYGSLKELTDLNVKNIVSVYWMQDCIDKCQLIDADAHPLYRPLKAPADLVFEGCVVALSSMNSLDKETYTGLLKDFGAIVQNRLVKRGTAGGPLQRNTHVVTCADVERIKCARKWDIPVVDPSWIIESLIKAEKQSIEGFLFDEEPLKGYVRTDKLWSALCSDKNGNASGRIDQSGNKRSSAKSVGHTSTDNVGMMNATGDDYEMDEEVLNQNDHRPSDSAGNVNNEVVGIETPASKRLKTLRSSGDSTPSFLNANAKNYKCQLDLQEAYKVVDTLQSCRTSSLSTEGVNWSESMVGHLLEEAAIKTAMNPRNESPKANHPSTSVAAEAASSPSTSTRILRQPKDLVSSSNVSTSMQKNDKRSAKTLDSDISSERTSAASKPKTSKNTALSSIKSALLRTRDNDSASTVSKRLSTEQRIDERHRNMAKQRMMEEKLASLAATYDGDVDVGSLTSVKATKNDTVDNDNEDDLLKQPSTSSKRQMSLRDDQNKGGDSESIQVVPVKKRFVFSSLSIEDRERLSVYVKKLNAEVCLDIDDDVTHLCCGTIIRNVKLMRSICSGKYIVLPDYIEDSHKAGKWLNESDFEWGAVGNLTKQSFDNPRQEMLAAACHRWRVKIELTSKRAFDGWCVLFYCSQRRLSDVTKIVECGGGTWYSRDDITLSDDLLNKVTVVLVERSKYWNDSEIDMLIERGVYCYPLDYLSTYLVETDLQPEQFLHKDYQARLKAKQDSNKSRASRKK